MRGKIRKLWNSIVDRYDLYWENRLVNRGPIDIGFGANPDGYSYYHAPSKIIRLSKEDTAYQSLHVILAHELAHASLGVGWVFPEWSRLLHELEAWAKVKKWLADDWKIDYAVCGFRLVNDDETIKMITDIGNNYLKYKRRYRRTYLVRFRDGKEEAKE